MTVVVALRVARACPFKQLMGVPYSERRRRLDSTTTKLIIDYSFGVVFEETSFVNETVLVDQVKAAMITRNTTASVTDILVQSAQVFSFVQLENMTVANNFTVYHQHTPWPSSQPSSAPSSSSHFRSHSWAGPPWSQRSSSVLGRAPHLDAL